MRATTRSNDRSKRYVASAKTSALDEVFGALSDPTRRAIISRLAGGSCSVSELGAPYAMSAPAISKHLAVLERAGFIVRWKTGRVHYCRLIANPFDQAESWIEQHRKFRESQLDRLAEYLDREEDECNPQPPNAQD